MFGIMSIILLSWSVKWVNSAVEYSLDICLNGDHSPGNYDGICVAMPPVILTGTVDSPLLDISMIKFRDLHQDWARDYIVNLATRWIIDNLSFYRWDDDLTRAEFLKIVIHAIPLNTHQQSYIHTIFRDVELNSWYESYVAIAFSKWLIWDAPYLRPHEPITRAEAMKILVLALWFSIPETDVMTFIDVSKNSHLAKYIEAAKSLNIISGQMRNRQHIFRPDDTITRSEIAKIIVNAFGL
jgi:hypothetical protein